MGLLSRLAVALAAVPALVAADPVCPRITSINYSGNGCPQNPSMSGNFNDPTFTYRNFALSIPSGNQTVNCQVHLQATGASPGWQVALKSNVVKGHVTLAPGTQLDYFTTIYFSENAANTDTVRGNIVNSGSSTLDQSVTLVSNTDGTTAWSPCIGSDGYTGIMNVNFRGVLSGGGRAYFEALSENWDLQWRRC